tara:strand:+ start:188 stop:958 length:771 start_codon:yes stop_codon:yes gene_type:complete
MKKNYITQNQIINSKISYGFFTRNGGFSNKNFSSLNCSYSNGDDKINVKKNILYAKKKLFLENKKIKFVSQIHSNKSIIVNKRNYKNRFEADGIITTDKEICIAILTADCCPIFLFDEENKFISCLHAGWKGVYSNIVKNTLNNIIKIQPNNNKIKAIIGPCLDRKNFQVSEDFKIKFIKINSNYKNFFISSKKNKKIFFDIKNIIKFQLKENKIKNIDDVNMDTYDNKDLFFSHRRATHSDQLPTGRMINIIGFK